MQVDRLVLKEILVLLGFGVATFLIAGYLDALEWFIEFSRDHEDWELDEILTTSLVLSIVLTILLFNRTKQLKNEIKRRKLYENEIALLASTDPLTKLPNRRHFIPRLEQSIAGCEDQNDIHAVLFVDIDDFKLVNDNHGHAVGDELLVSISQVLTQSVRKTDLVSRFAGDEFVIHLSGIKDRDEAVIVAKKILESAESAHHTGASLSIGIAFTSEDVVSAEKLIAAADKAMYMAKKEGKNGFYFVN